MTCYLDMDGLLANLFDVISQRLHGKPYRHSDERDKLFTRELWNNRGDFLQKIGDIENLFAQLSPYPTNAALLEAVIAKFGGFWICSSPTKLDIEGCKRGKDQWIQEHIIPDYGAYLRGVIFTDQKYRYAVGEEGPNVLIDDYRPYIDAWKRRGGIGVRVRSDRFVDNNGFEAYLQQAFIREGIA